MIYSITLTQSTTNHIGTNGYGMPNNFTWQLQNIDHNVDVVFFADDLSDNPDYYNTFDITLSSTQSGLTAGIININAGTYEYKIYQMNEPYNLNIDDAISLVETGIAYVEKKIEL